MLNVSCNTMDIEPEKSSKQDMTFINLAYNGAYPLVDNYDTHTLTGAHIYYGTIQHCILI